MVYVYLCILLVYFLPSTCARNCDHINCANIFDEVCGFTEYKNSTYSSLTIYQNICMLRLRLCREESIAGIYEVADHLCNIQKPVPRGVTEGGRRVSDFGIVGAHQACNHTCPTYCNDIYHPVCAKIWKFNMTSYQLRTMINHCHVDQFSCAAGLNVTILPLGSCIKNEPRLLFVQQVAALKSLQLLDDQWSELSRRRSYTHDPIDHFLTEDIRGLLWKFRYPEDTFTRREFETVKRPKNSRKPFQLTNIVYESFDPRSPTDEEKIKSHLSNLVKRIFA